ncbi:MAG: hypothetical protein ABI763_00170 [Bacteroidota bacterium]
MSTNPTRKPSAASESFITALAILFFASLAILFMWLDNRKRIERQSHNTIQAGSETPIALQEKQNRSSSPEQTRQENMERLVYPNGEGATNQVVTVHGSGIVSPPLPLLDVLPQHITLNAGTGQIITSGHESDITLQPNAFVDKEIAF